MKKCIRSKRATTLLMISSVAFLCLLLPLSYSLFIGGDSLTNTFTAGENTSHIKEKFGRYAVFEEGKCYEKRVAVKNDGTVPCYVRVLAEIEEPHTAEALSIDFNTIEWTNKQEDGFYYYKKVLAVGEITEPLFTRLEAKEEVRDFEMICCSETVQAYGAEDAVSAFGAYR